MDLKLGVEQILNQATTRRDMLEINAKTDAAHNSKLEFFITVTL